MIPPAIVWFCAPVGLLLSALTAALVGLWARGQGKARTVRVVG